MIDYVLSIQTAIDDKRVLTKDFTFQCICGVLVACSSECYYPFGIQQSANPSQLVVYRAERPSPGDHRMCLVKDQKRYPH